MEGKIVSEKQWKNGRKTKWKVPFSINFKNTIAKNFKNAYWRRESSQILTLQKKMAENRKQCPSFSDSWGTSWKG